MTPHDGAVVVWLPLPPHELHPNARVHWRQVTVAKRKAREDAVYAALEAVGRAPRNLHRVRASARYTFPVKRRRDSDGLEAWLKYYRDGIAAVLMADGDDHGWEWERVEAVVDTAALPGVVITVREAA